MIEQTNLGINFNVMSNYIINEDTHGTRQE